MNKPNWRNYSFEFLSIFIAVLSAFALNNWNESRRDRHAESKIITEIKNGLIADLEDVKINKKGHEDGLKACEFWRKVITGVETKLDSMPFHYFNLTRDYISIQNVSGYESLKSKGLEILQNDSLRFAIISLYEYDYNILKKFEEEYWEMQFQANYYKEINKHLAPNIFFNEAGSIVGIDLPLNLSEANKKILLTYLWEIQINRYSVLGFYAGVEEKINKVLDQIERN